MTKVRTTSSQNQQHTRAEEFHEKLEKGAKTATLHRVKTQQDSREAQLAAPADRGHSRSRATHLKPAETTGRRTNGRWASRTRERIPEVC